VFSIFLSSSNNIINKGEEEDNRAHDNIIENTTSIAFGNGQNKSERKQETTRL
jgi:hypothetical protein